MIGREWNQKEDTLASYTVSVNWALEGAGVGLTLSGTYGHFSGLQVSIIGAWKGLGDVWTLDYSLVSFGQTRCLESEIQPGKLKVTSVLDKRVCVISSQ